MFTFNSSPGRNSLSSILTNSQGDRHELSTATTGCPEARQKKIIPSKQEIIPSKKYESSNDKKDRLNISHSTGQPILLEIPTPTKHDENDELIETFARSFPGSSFKKMRRTLESNVSGQKPVSILSGLEKSTGSPDDQTLSGDYSVNSASTSSTSDSGAEEEAQNEARDTINHIAQAEYMCDSMKSLFSIEQFGAQAANEICAAMELLHEEKMKNIAMLRELFAIQRPEVDMKIHELHLREQGCQVEFSKALASLSSANDDNSPPVSPQSTKNS